MSEPVTTKEYFGGCPECGRTDGYVNAGAGHWNICCAHKNMWCFGTNLFSDWKGETEAEQIRIWNELGLDDFREVKPIYPPETETLNGPARFLTA
jgi:hypothetical protein